jgi:membrane fusion protein, multidrug efflux system
VTACCLHVVASRRSPLAAALQKGIGGRVRVRLYERGPPVSALDEDDVLVVDLDSLPPSLDVEYVDFVVGKRDVWLVFGDRPVAPDWLAVAHHHGARLVHCDTAEPVDGYESVLVALQERIVGPRGEEITALVLAAEPVLAGFAPLVRAICCRPREMRRPADLAAAVDMTRAAVRRSLSPLGFRRVEHFITMVRYIAFEQLTSKRRVPIGVARRLTGIIDPSNLRRQLARARRGSRGVLRWLKTVATSLALLLALPLGACRDKVVPGGAAAAAAGARESDSAIALPVVGAVVRRGDLILTIRTTGQVRAERQVTLKGETQGTVDAVVVRPGDRVDSGQVLVRLDPRPFDLAVREAESQVGEALGRYRDVLLGDDTTDAAPAALERRRNARVRTGVDGAEARLERAKLDRERATFRAPFGGTVDQVHAVVGQRVGAGDAIATVVDLGSLIVEAAVLEHDLPLVRRGATASVSLAAAGDRAYAGRVLAVLPLVDTTTRAGRALVRVRTGDGLLRPGMYADVELEATRLPDRVVVPSAAIIERDGRPLVFRYHEGRAEWVYVTPGRSNGRETEILPDSATGRAAVAAGETVLVEGHLTLTHDAPVRLLARDGS